MRALQVHAKNRRQLRPQVEGSPRILQRLATTQGVELEVRWDSKGVHECPGSDDLVIIVHIGPATKLECWRDGRRFNGIAVHGDIDVIPASTPARWEMHDYNDCGLLLSLPQALMHRVMEESDLDLLRVKIYNRFQIRDVELEKLSWAMKREMEIGCPSGRLYLDGLTVAMVSRLLAQHSSVAKKGKEERGGLVGHRLKLVLSFIEERLEEDLSLETIAAVAGLSTSHLNALFHQSVGMSLHQYVIRRRLERAKTLLTQDRLSITEIALATGFAHPSHLARHMRRTTGVSTRAIRRLLGENRQ
jgi:AraC family transcriptional regulator